MAEAFFNALAPDGFSAASAGTHPAAHVNPVVVQAMAEAGIDISGAVPRAVTDEMVASSDIVATMGCGVDASCPMLPGARAREDWGLDDPAGQPIDVVRRIRGDVRARVEDLIERMKKGETGVF